MDGPSQQTPDLRVTAHTGTKLVTVDRDDYDRSVPLDTATAYVSLRSIVSVLLLKLPDRVSRVITETKANILKRTFCH